MTNSFNIVTPEADVGKFIQVFEQSIRQVSELVFVKVENFELGRILKKRF